MERERESEMCQQQPKCVKGADNEACVCLLVLLQSVLIAVSLWPLFHLIYALLWVCAYVCVLLPWPFAGHTRLPFIFVQINQSTLKCRKDKGK